MKVKATVTETSTYIIWVDVHDDATDDQIDTAAQEEWGANPGRKPDDYDCDIEVDYPVSDEARSYGPRK
jgi:hypothetical protein